MNEYKKSLEVRWADLDPNFHVRHSVYYDWAATIRTSFLYENGLTHEVMMKEHFGPVLFREECQFRREIRFGDVLEINYKALKIRKDYARFTMQHEIIGKDGTLHAIITVDGAWMDTQLRKLAMPPDIIKKMVDVLPKSEHFEWTEIPVK